MEIHVALFDLQSCNRVQIHFLIASSLHEYAWAKASTICAFANNLNYDKDYFLFFNDAFITFLIATIVVVVCCCVKHRFFCLQNHLHSSNGRLTNEIWKNVKEQSILQNIKNAQFSRGGKGLYFHFFCSADAGKLHARTGWRAWVAGHAESHKAQAPGHKMFSMGTQLQKRTDIVNVCSDHSSRRPMVRTVPGCWRKVVDCLLCSCVGRLRFVIISGTTVLSHLIKLFVMWKSVAAFSKFTWGTVHNISFHTALTCGCMNRSGVVDNIIRCAFQHWAAVPAS